MTNEQIKTAELAADLGSLQLNKIAELFFKKVDLEAAKEKNRGG